MAACACTCGHHYGRGAEADMQTPTNAALGTTPQQGSNSSSDGDKGSSTSTSNNGPTQQHQLNRPLDASFVQVPHYPQHPYDDPYSNSYHSSLSLGTTSKQQQQQQEEEQKRRAFLTGEAPHSEKAESYRRLVLLQKVALGDGEPPPSLCPSCVQRYVVKQPKALVVDDICCSTRSNSPPTFFLLFETL